MLKVIWKGKIFEGGVILGENFFEMRDARCGTLVIQSNEKLLLLVGKSNNLGRIPIEETDKFGWNLY